MLILRCALAVFVLIVCCGVSKSALPPWPVEWADQSPYRRFFAKGTDLMDQFAVINKILEKDVRSEEIDANFKHIDLALKLPWGITGKSGGKAMKEALLIFSSLRQINEKNRCNLNAYNILKMNYNAANGLPEWGYERDFAKRRINKIVRTIVDRHVEACKGKYFDLYRDQVKKVNPGLKVFAETLARNLIYHKYGKEEGKEILGDAEKLLKYTLREGHKCLKPVYLLQEMRRLAKNDPNSKYVEPIPTEWLGRQVFKTNKEELSKLTMKYLHKPCKEYVIKVETIFVPADYDNRFLPTPAKSDELDYYLNWAAFELCDTLALHTVAAQSTIAEYTNRMAKEGKPF